jgi:hypothetical protein
MGRFLFGAQVTDAPLQKDPNVSELIEKQLGSHPGIWYHGKTFWKTYGTKQYGI